MLYVGAATMLDTTRPRTMPNVRNSTYNQTPPPDTLTEREREHLDSPIPVDEDNRRPSLTINTTPPPTTIPVRRSLTPPPSYNATTDPSDQDIIQLALPQTIIPPTGDRKMPLSSNPVSLHAPQPRALHGQPSSAISPLPLVAPPTSPSSIVSPLTPGAAPAPAIERHPDHQVRARTFSGHINAVPLNHMNMLPAVVDCPVCQGRSMTRTKNRIGNTQHAWALGATALTGVLGFIPYLIPQLKDVEHYCGACGAHLAIWHKSGSVDVLRKEESAK